MRYLAYTKGSKTSIVEYNGALLENVAKVIPGSVTGNFSYDDVKKLVEANGGIILRDDGKKFSNVAVSGCPVYYFMNGFTAIVFSGEAIRFVVAPGQERKRENFDFSTLTPKTFMCSYPAHILNCEATSYAYVYGGILQTFDVPDGAFNNSIAEVMLYSGYKLYGIINPKKNRIPWIKLPDNRKSAEICAKYLLGEGGETYGISPDSMFNVLGGSYGLLKTDAIAAKCREVSSKIFNEPSASAPDFGPFTKYLGLQPTKDIYEGKMVAAVAMVNGQKFDTDVLAYVYDGGTDDANINDLQTEGRCAHYAILDSDLNVFLARLDAMIDEADRQFMKDYSALLRTKVNGMMPEINQYYTDKLAEQLTERLGIPSTTDGTEMKINLPLGENKATVDAILTQTAFDFDKKEHVPTFGPNFKAKVDEKVEEVVQEAVGKKYAVDGYRDKNYKYDKDSYIVGSGLNQFESDGLDGSYPLTKPYTKTSDMVIYDSAQLTTNVETGMNSLVLKLRIHPCYAIAWEDVTGQGMYTLCRAAAQKIINNMDATLSEANIEHTLLLEGDDGWRSCGTTSYFGYKVTSYRKCKKRRCGVVALGVLTAGISVLAGSRFDVVRYSHCSDEGVDWDPAMGFFARLVIPLSKSNIFNATYKGDVYKLYEDHRLDTIAAKICPEIEKLLGDIEAAAVDKWFCLVQDTMVYSFFTGLLHSNMYLTYSTIRRVLQHFEVYRQRGVLTENVKNFLANLEASIVAQYAEVDLQLGIDTKIYGEESFQTAQKVSGDEESFALYNFMED